MAKTRKQYDLGIRLKETTTAAAIQGEIRVDSADDKLKVYLDGAERSIVSENQSQTLTNKTIDADDNTISDLEVDNLKAGVLDTDLSSVSASHDTIPSAKAVKDYVDGQIDTIDQASEITYSNATSGLTATDVQAAIDEVEARVDSAGSHIAASTNVHGLSGGAAVVGDISSQALTNKTIVVSSNTITTAASGNLAATELNAALDELQDDIDTRALNSDLGTHTGASSGVHGVVGSVVGTSDSQTLTNKSLTAAILTGITKLSDYISEEVANSAVTGTAATLTSPAKPIIRLTDASLVSLTGISALESAGHGGVLTLINATGNEITILNNAGTASEKILTGTDDDIALASNAALLLKYDVTSDLWRIIGGSGAGGSSVLNYIAGENVSIRDALYISEGAADGARTAGRAYKLDASSEKRIKFVGFAKSTITSGNAVKIVSSGVLKDFSGLSAGLPLYLNPASAGGYTQTEPVTTDVWKLKIGLALSATEVLILPDQGLNASFNEIEGSFTIANNQAAAANVTNVAFSSSVTKSFILDYSIFRSSSLESYAQAGRLRGVYNSTTTQWLMSDDYSGQNAGVTFSITSGGQVQYVSSNMTGTGYSGSLEYRVSSGDGVAIAGGASGSSGINYVSNPDFIDNANGYTAYKDADLANVEDGTGGPPTGLSISRSTSSPLRGAASGLIAKTSGASRRGEGVSDDFNIDTADQGKMLEISFDYNVTSNYVDGDMRVYIYDVTNAVVIEPSQRDILANAGQATYRSYFQAASNSVSYRVIWHVATSTTLAYDLKIDNVKVGPILAGNAGTFVSDWQSWTPTGSWSTNTTYTGKYRRVGDTAEFEVKVSLAGAPTAAPLTINLPSGMSIDTNKTVASTASGVCFGYGVGNDAGVQNYDLTLLYNNTTSVTVFPRQVTASNITLGSQVTATNPITWGNTDTIQVHFSMPITGWSTGVSASEISTSATIASKATLSANQTISSASPTEVTFNSVIYDNSGSLGSNGFTAPESGRYSVSGAVLADNCTNGENYYLNIRVAGVSKYTSQNIASSGSFILPFATEVSLEKGQLVTIVTSTSADTSYLVRSGEGLSSFCVSKINNPAQIAPTEFVGCSYSTNAAQSIPNNAYTTVVYEDRVFDSHSAMNTSTGVYTVPVSGNYIIYASLSYNSFAWTASKYYESVIRKNSAQVGVSTNQTEASATYVKSSQTSHSGTFTKGDTIDIQTYQDSGSSRALIPTGQYNQIFITKVS